MGRDQFRGVTTLNRQRASGRPPEGALSAAAITTLFRAPVVFVQRQVWAMGFQELCLLCYETQWLRHSQVERVAQSLLWPPATV